MDVVFINSSSGKKNYQELSEKYSAIETPTWILLLAESCRSKGKKVCIIDANAENLSNEDVLKRLEKINARLICFVVYGQNVNAGTANMAGATDLANYIKLKNKNFVISFLGSHMQAVPAETLKNEKNIDFVFTNEGVYSLINILNLKNFELENLKTIKGIAYRNAEKIIINPAEKVVPNELMDQDLPGYAWDLLPFKEKPLDLYRSPMWHAGYNEYNRSPYAAIQTSLGCQFNCSFCMINIINRDDEEEIGVASNYNKMRFWSPNFIIKEFDKLIKMGVRTIKIVDEMFLLNPKYYVPLCELLSKRNEKDDLLLWAYSRIDTVKRPEILKLVRKAGIRWLCLGIESGDKKVRLEISKGKFDDVDVRQVVQKIEESNIQVMANYIFGLPGDDLETMQKTMNLSLELCTAGWNAYAAMALPGSQLYKEAKEQNLALPEVYDGFSFHSYNTFCLSTDRLDAYQILKFRDESFYNYHSNPIFLNKINKLFGERAVENITEMLKIKLKRKIIEEKKNVN